MSTRTRENLGYAEDVAAETGDTGLAVLAVRRDSASPGVDADGDFAFLSVDADGALRTTTTLTTVDLDIRDLVFATDKVDVSGSTVTVTEPVSVDDNAGSLTVDSAQLPAALVGGRLSVIADGTGTLANGAETTVDGTAGGVQIIAADTARKAVIIQNVGVANIRVGVTGVAATTGVRLVPGATLILEQPHVPTAALFAIREGSTSSTALAQQIT